MPWLLEAKGWNPDAGAIGTVYFSDVGLVTTPSDAPANTYWTRAIDVPPSLARGVFGGSGDIGGPSEASGGTIVLANDDGKLDSLRAWTFDGHDLTIRYTAIQTPVLADFSVVLMGVSRQPTIGDRVDWEVADRRDVTDTAYQPMVFAGTGGAEGDTAWKDVRRPRALGLCQQVEAARIDEANEVWCYGDGKRCGGPLALRDQGVWLRRAADYPNYAAMMAASFGGKDYVTCDALNLWRLAQPAAGPLVADLAGRTKGADLVSNGSFASGLTGWGTTGTGWSGTSRADKAAGAAGTLTQTIGTEVGAWYALKASIGVTTAGVVQAIAGGVSLGDFASGDTCRTFVFQATGATTLLSVSVDSVFAGWIDDVSVYQLAARAADMIEVIIDDDTPYGLGDLNATDLTALNTAQSAALQHWHPADGEATVPLVISAICTSIGAWHGWDPATGLFRVAILNAPSVSPVHSFDDRQIEEVTPRPSAERLRKLTLEWGQRWRPLQAGEIAGLATGDAVLERDLMAASRPAVATHAATETQAKKYSDPVLASLFVHEAPALAEAQRRAALHGPLRDWIEVVMLEDVPGLSIGMTVRITFPRFLLNAGKNFVVLRTERSGPEETLTMILWG